MGSFIDSFSATLNKEFGNTVNRTLDTLDPKERGWEELEEIFGDSKYNGKKVKDMSKAERRKEIATLVKKMSKHMKEISTAVRKVGGKMREDLVSDLSSSLTAAADVVYGAVCDDYKPDGFHTTLVRMPNGKVNSEFATAVTHNMLSNLVAQFYPLNDPVEMHQLLYHMFLSMASVEARKAARVYLKNIDTAGLMENANVEKVMCGDAPFSEFFKDKAFFDYCLSANPDGEAMSKALKEEEHFLTKKEEE